MKHIFSKSLLIALALILCINLLRSQTNTDHPASALYNTKKNYVFLNFSLGGGDYPAGGLGINLSRQFFNSNTMIGVGAHYIGDRNTLNPENIQIFPLMVDIRQLFMASSDGRFATLLIADAGYTVRINGHGTDEDGEYEYRNGWAINPGISFRFNIFKNMGVMFDITWLHHWCPQVWLPPVEKKEKMHWDVGLVRGNIFF